MLLFAHSVSVKDGDVITLANDTLREKGSGYEDFGLDCQLTVKRTPTLSIGGMCNVFVTDKKHPVVIKPVEVRDRLVWIKVFEDPAQGVAGYVMAEEGADLAVNRRLAFLCAGLLFAGLAQAIELADSVALELAYTGEFVRNLKPGLIDARKRTTYDDLLDLSLSVDRKHWGMFVHAARMHGPDASAQRIGDLQTASNIEAPDQTLLYEAWLEARFGKKWRWGLLAGLHDLNSEFYVSEYASLFTNSSFGIGPEISANVPTSIYPRLGVAVRLRVENEQGASLAFAVYDGDPATRAVRAQQEGLMFIGELALYWQDLGHPGGIKLGAWQHTANKPSPFGTGVVFRSVSGRYLLLEQEFASWDDGDFGIFVQYGATQRDRNEVPAYWGIGLHLRGFLPGRPMDELGLVLNSAQWQTQPNQAAPTDERVLELTWLMALWQDKLFLQPSWQRIERPGGVSGKRIDVLLLRALLSL